MLKDCPTNFQAGKRVGDTILDVYWMSHRSVAYDSVLDSYTIARPNNLAKQKYYVVATDMLYDYAYYTLTYGGIADCMIFDNDVIINPQGRRAVNPGAQPNIGLMWNAAINPQYSPILNSIQDITQPMNVLFRAEGQMNPQLCKDSVDPIMNKAAWLSANSYHPSSVTTTRKLVYSAWESRGLIYPSDFVATSDFVDPVVNYTGRFC